MSELPALYKIKDFMLGLNTVTVLCVRGSPTLLKKFWWISMYVTDDDIAKLYVTKSLLK